MLEFIKHQKKWLVLGSAIGFLPTLTILLVGFFYPGDHLSALGFWLHGVLASSGILPLGLVFLGLSLLGAIAGALVTSGIRYLQTRGQTYELWDQLREEEEASSYNFQQGDLTLLGNERIISRVNDAEVPVSSEDTSKSVETFKQWGNEIGESILMKVIRGESAEAKNQYETEMPNLKRSFYVLIKEYHPDKNVGLASEQKALKEEACKMLLNIYDDIKSQWDAALKGIKISSQSTAPRNYSYEDIKQRIQELSEEMRMYWQEQDRKRQEYNSMYDKEHQEQMRQIRELRTEFEQRHKPTNSSFSCTLF